MTEIDVTLNDVRPKIAKFPSLVAYSKPSESMVMSPSLFASGS